MAMGSDTRRVLVYTRNGEGYVHDNVPETVKAIEGIGEETGFRIEATDAPAVFTEESLARFRAVVFANTNREALTSDAQRAALQAYVESGGGFVGVHSAATSEPGWEWFAHALGGTFDWHPPLQPFRVRVVDREHPATSDLTETTWDWEDELYFMRRFEPDVRVLMAADLASVRERGDHPELVELAPDPYPVVWCQEVGKGRAWYTALGHKKEHYDDPGYLRHLKGGILWAMEAR